MGGEQVESGSGPDAVAALEAVASLIEAGDPKALYSRIIDVALELLEADSAGIHARTAPESPQLRLVASRGLSPEAAAVWERADADSGSRWGRALARGERIAIPEVERSEVRTDTEDLRHMRLCGIRAVQAIPLLSRGGELLGMLSMHWQREYHPSGEMLRLLDALARVLARLLERTSAQEARRASEASLRVRVAALERIDREKNSFLAMLAHELRNPLAPVRNAAEVLAYALHGQPAALRPLAILKRQTDQLTRLVDDLLDISRIQQGRLTLQQQPVELGGILQQAVETVQPLVREKRHDLGIERLQSPVFVLGDKARLVQCVANLLQNAAKYTQPGGRIRVAVAELGARVSIAVSDNGAGIPPALLPHVFEPFVQSDETLEHSRGGLGIGLAIVKRLVEMHGGSVEAASPGEGRGSTFTIHLWRLESPLVPPPESATTMERAPTEARLRRILVIDANADAADTMAAVLTAEGHRMDVAYSALSALSAAERLRPDAILLDLDLPRMNGYGVARRLRAQPALAATLLIAVSDRKEDESAARAAGFDAHLTKPIDMAALAQVLAR